MWSRDSYALTDIFGIFKYQGENKTARSSRQKLYKYKEPEPLFYEWFQFDIEIKTRKIFCNLILDHISLEL